MVYVIFATSEKGFGWENFINEANQGKGMKIAKCMRLYYNCVLPVIIFAIFIIGLINYFK